MSDSLTRRGGTWHFVRRVPIEFAELDPRGIVRYSTRGKFADDRTGRRGARAAHTLNDALEGGSVSRAGDDRRVPMRRRARLFRAPLASRHSRPVIRERLQNLPTGLTISSDDVDLLKAAGKDLVLNAPLIASFKRELPAPVSNARETQIVFSSD